MAEATIPVDLLNPGQVFACLGFLEAADILLGDARGGFDWSDAGDVRFRLVAASRKNPIQAVLDFIMQSDRCSISPLHDVHERDGWNTEVRPGAYQSRLWKRNGKMQNALLPVECHLDGDRLRFDYWGDNGTGRARLLLWTATNGNSSRVRFEKLFAAAEQAVQDHPSFVSDPFNAAAEVAANYRLEMRRNWVSLDLGFSPDKLNKGPKALKLAIVTYPFVELLAALGLGFARPLPLDETPLEWTYFVWRDLLPSCLARPALGSVIFETQRQFAMRLEVPNDGGDLSISSAFEVNRHD